MKKIARACDLKPLPVEKEAELISKAKASRQHLRPSLTESARVWMREDERHSQANRFASSIRACPIANRVRYCAFQPRFQAQASPRQCPIARAFCSGG